MPTVIFPLGRSLKTAYNPVLQHRRTIRSLASGLLASLISSLP